jgi:hypothetical protein
MSINALVPTGPHIEGFIRFASEGEEDLRQLSHFEVLERSHACPPVNGRQQFKQHPIAASLDASGDETPHIKVIPIKLIFDEPEANLSARFEAYDQEVNRLVCAGDGQRARRTDLVTGKVEDASCAGSDLCPYANSQGVSCSMHVRLKLQIEGQRDPFSVFEFRSGSINTFRTLSAKLKMMHAAFKSKLRHIPLSLVAHERSSAMSNFLPFYVADLQLREGMSPRAALELAEAQRKEEQECGLDFDAMEEAVKTIYANAPLHIDDAEVGPITFERSIVDRASLRMRLPRNARSTEQPTSIEAAVQSARIQGTQQLAPENLAPPSHRAGDDLIRERCEEAASTSTDEHVVAAGANIQSEGGLQPAEEAAIFSI